MTAPTTTWRAPCPLYADDVLDHMHGEICDEADDSEELAVRMFNKAESSKARLQELLDAAWSAFVDEVGLTEEHVAERTMRRALESSGIPTTGGGK